MLTKSKTGSSPIGNAPIYTQKFRFKPEAWKVEFQDFPTEFGFAFWTYWKNLTGKRFFYIHLIKETWNKIDSFETKEELENNL